MLWHGWSCARMMTQGKGKVCTQLYLVMTMPLTWALPGDCCCARMMTPGKGKVCTQLYLVMMMPLLGLTR